MASVRVEIDDLTHELDKYLYYDKEGLDKAAEEEAIERILQEGYDKGYDEGKQLGIEQGIEKDKNEEKDSVVKSLLEHEMDVEFISEITGLTANQINNIKKECTK